MCDLILILKTSSIHRYEAEAQRHKVTAQGHVEVTGGNTGKQWSREGDRIAEKRINKRRDQNS